MKKQNKKIFLATSGIDETAKASLYHSLLRRFKTSISAGTIGDNVVLPIYHPLLNLEAKVKIFADTLIMSDDLGFTGIVYQRESNTKYKLVIMKIEEWYLKPIKEGKKSNKNKNKKSKKDKKGTKDCPACKKLTDKKYLNKHFPKKN